MRIIIATGIFPPDIGGPATYSELLAREFFMRGHHIEVVTYGESAKCKVQSAKLQCKIHTVSKKIPKGLRHVVYFWNVLRAGKRADIIYAQDAVSAGFPVALVALLLRKKFFLKVVGDHAWEQGMQRFGVTVLLDKFLLRTYGLQVEFLRRVEKFVAIRARRVIVPSEYLRSVVCQWGVPPEHIVVIPNAVSLPEAIPSRKEVRNILGFAEDEFILISAGRLVPWKGFQMLIALMPRLIEKIPSTKLIIIGDGPESECLKAKSYKLKAPIIFTGGISKEQLGMYLVSADIFLLNTAYEGFSHQLVEAMALGVPVITTDAGGNKELLRDDENALIAQYNNVVDWEEKVLRLYNDTELCQRLIYANKGIASRYSIETTVEHTEHLLLTT